jgi:hypothetical protein
MHAQTDQMAAMKGKGDLSALLHSLPTWTV